MEPFRQELEDLFGQFFAEPFEQTTRAIQTWSPRVDVEETDKEIVVKADLPGVEAKDVDVSVIDGILVVRGERKETREESKKNYQRMERFVGKFYREVPLPPGVDADKIVGSSVKGVITVTIPKVPAVQPKRIVVKAQD